MRTRIQRRLANRCADNILREIKRTFWKVDLLKDDYHGDREVRVRQPEATANLVSSLLENGYHAPTLDIDIQTRLVPSTTPGHYHLYIDHPMTWRKYRKLLRALYKAGIIEEGFYNLSKQRKSTYVRKPGVLKEKRDAIY